MSAAAALESLAAAVERRLERRWSITFVICLLAIAHFLGFRGADPDLLHRLALGRYFFDTGRVPVIDPFAFTPKLSLWIDHEWLCGIIFYAIYNQLGDLGLFVAKCLVLVATVAALMGAARGQRPGAVFALLCVFGSAYIWTSTVRAQVLTYAGLAYLAWAISRFELKQQALPLLFVPILMPVWANCHAGFVLGLLLVGVWGSAYLLLTRATRRSKSIVVIAGGLAAAVTLINPYGETGLAYWRAILHGLSMSRPTITEWESTDLFSPGSILIWLLLLVDIAGLTIASRRKYEEQVGGRLIYGQGKPGLCVVTLILGFSFYCALKHQRFVALFLLANLWLGGEFWRACVELLRVRWPEFCAKWQVAKNVAIFGASVFALVLIFLAVPGLTNFKLSTSAYPEAAVRWLKTSAKPGRILVDFNNGSYVMWELGPKFQISLDSRFEAVYPESTVVQVSKAFDFISEAGAKARAELHPDYIIVPDYLTVSAGRALPGEGFSRVLPTLYIRREN